MKNEMKLGGKEREREKIVKDKQNEKIKQRNKKVQAIKKRRLRKKKL